MQPFNLEAFKAGQKALTRGGRIATFVGICEQCEDVSKLLAVVDNNGYTTNYTLNGRFGKSESSLDLISMVSRRQHLIYSYDPEDTWQCKAEGLEWLTLNTDLLPSFDDQYEWRVHPHNALIKAHKNGAKIESYICGEWIEVPTIDWYEDTQYRIKSEPKTKTVYEWIHGANVGGISYFVSSWVADEDVEYFFGLDAPKQKYKTGRSCEVEV